MKEKLLKLQTPDVINDIKFIILPLTSYKDYKIHAGIECENVTEEEKEHQEKIKINYKCFNQNVFEVVSIKTLKTKIDKYCDVCFGDIPVSGEKTYKTYNLKKVINALEKSVLLTNITELETNHLTLYSQALTPLYEFTNFENVAELYHYFLETIEAKFKELLPTYLEKEKVNIWVSCLKKQVANYPEVNAEEIYSYIKEPEYVIFNGRGIRDDMKEPSDAMLYGSSLLRQVLSYNNLKRIDSGMHFSLVMNGSNVREEPFCLMLKVHYEAVKNELFETYYGRKDLGPETLTITKNERNIIESINGLYDKNNVNLQDLNTLFEIATMI